jgi:hypothetical protein
MLTKRLISTVKATTTGSRLSKTFAERTYGNLKNSDRIFTNLYRDGSPWIDGALKRVGFSDSSG